MPGLFFIALNRILAPAFYAQSDSRSPTLAGIISFGANIALAAVLVGPMKGRGVALALTAASAANTALLLAFLARNRNVAVSRALGPAALYALKLVLFSCAAAAPVVFLSPRLGSFFGGRGRFVSYGLPLALEALVFAAVGIALLAITGDRQFKAIAGMLRGRRFRKKDPHAQ